MRISIVSSRQKNKSEWHRWFAWKPVKLTGSSPVEYAWLTIIERREIHTQRGGFSWPTTEYRL